jgi:hypothetical protein
LLYGIAEGFVAVSQGQVATFRDDQIVAYVFGTIGAQRLFVFRTLGDNQPGAATVPGVWPKVRLLAEFKRAGRIDRVERLFAYLAKHRWDPSLLSDAFWLRISNVLGGHLPRQKALLSLLASEPLAQSAETIT